MMPELSFRQARRNLGGDFKVLENAELRGDMSGLNERARRLTNRMADDADGLKIRVRQIDGGGTLLDCGIEAVGGLQAGLLLAQVCLSDLAGLDIVPGAVGDVRLPLVTVRTDHPVEACLYSQYAGWAVGTDDFFGMGSGPIRACAATEAVFERHEFRETAKSAVAVLETGQIPNAAVYKKLADKTGLQPNQITIAAARTASLAGTVQVVARSVETALHKLFELDWDVRRIVSAFGSAPLPPVARNDLEGIGRTNDAILYGGRVHLWVTGDDESIAEVLPRVPSASSPAHGKTFLEVFEEAGRDFYKIDPHLFSPGEIVVQNIETGVMHQAGHLEPDLLIRSFGAAAE